MARKDEYKVERNSWSYQVTGRGRFPVDMLRYDGAFPHQSGDARKIEQSLDWHRPGTEVYTIRLRSHTQTPTVERWRTFGWTVEPIRSLHDEPVR